MLNYFGKEAEEFDFSLNPLKSNFYDLIVLYFVNVFS